MTQSSEFALALLCGVLAPLRGILSIRVRAGRGVLCSACQPLRLSWRAAAAFSATLEAQMRTIQRRAAPSRISNPRFGVVQSRPGGLRPIRARPSQRNLWINPAFRHHLRFHVSFGNSCFDGPSLTRSSADIFSSIASLPSQCSCHIRFSQHRTITRPLNKLRPLWLIAKAIWPVRLND
jgi:hypothetical protein